MFQTSRALLVSLLAAAGSTASVLGQIEPHAGMMRYPDVGKTQIAFVYAGDVWLAPRAGGMASRLTSAPGQEAFPRFSPDDQTVAFVGNYEGNRDIYTIPTAGGVATRITHHPGAEILCDWTPDGKQLIFALSGLAGLRRQTELFTVPATGGMPTPLPVPYGANGAISDDGTWLAYTPHSTDTRTWKRYRGGMATDVWLFNLKDNTSKRITDWEGTDTQPMWHGGNVYYISDEGPEHRLNVWFYDVGKGTRRQVTTLKDYDVKWPSIGPGPNGKGEIVYQYGAGLFLLDLGTEKATQVTVTIPGDRPTIRTHQVDDSNFIQDWSISPSAKRVVAAARGDLWSLPGENGTPRALTRTSGVAERSPAWSPDGRWIAYFSDATGEYELYITQSDGLGSTRQLTKPGPAPTAFRYNPTWSPDSKSIVFTDKAGRIFLCTLPAEDKEGAEANTKLIDTDPWAGQPNVSWSQDNKWITYSYQVHSRLQSAVYVYNIEKGEKHQVTSGFFADGSPVFDRKGDYLFYISSRNFSPTYSDIDNSFIYNGSQEIIAVPLRADMESPWQPKSDEEDWTKLAKEDKKDEKKDDAKEGDKKKEEKKEGDQPAAAVDDGVSGTWDCKATGPEPLPPEGLPFTLKLNLHKDNTVSGTMSSALHNGSFSNGKWDAGSKTLTFSIDVEDAKVQFTITLDGTTLKGTAAVGNQNFALSGKRTAAGPSGDEKKGETAEDKGKDEKKKDLVIDFDGLEGRGMALPIHAGAFGQLGVNDKNQLIFVRRPVAGDGDGGIKLFDLTDEKKEEKSITSGNGFDITPDGKKLLVPRGNSAVIVDASAGATGKNVVTGGMTAHIEPRLEWKQLFMDAWRIERDYFYDPDMHHVNWAAVRDQYAKMLDDAASREDISYIISEMISELNVGHAYYSGGDIESQPTVSVGMLGCDFELVPANGDAPAAYRIKKIISGAAWDSDARGPLSQPGVKVKAGDYLMAVNGIPVDPSLDVWAAFQGLAGKTITITVNDKPSLERPAKADEKKDEAKKEDEKKEDKPREIKPPKGLRDVVVTTLGGEDGLRFRSWVESKRAYVDLKSGGKIAYIYVPDTGLDGQNNLFRQFYGQAHKQALIVDDRWNGGGQIPTRFIELLNRPVTNYWARRDGQDWTWPPDSMQGPKCMLINGLAGSGGDMFPWLFRYNKLGKLIGMRTWGGLVGISGNPGLIDGGSVTVPTFGFYKKDGTWGVEGHGVDPDMMVLDDPAQMLSYRDGSGGSDPQLDAAIKHMLEEIEKNPYTPPKKPAYPDRSGMSVDQKDW
jgi:tricorn protease-like protein/C-terminal processing protease CtpA/Prc